MQTTPPPLRLIFVSLLTLAAVFLINAHAVVIVDPDLVQGTDAIDPAGEHTVDQDGSGATSEAVLEAVPGLAAIQDLTGWQKQLYSSYVVFTDEARADIMGTYAESTGSDAGKWTHNSALRTSPGNSIRINSELTENTSLTLDFGSATYNGTSVTAFDTASKSSPAAGFSICGLENVSTSVTVTFYGTDDATVLSTQTLYSAAETDPGDPSTYGSDGYVGFVATGMGVESGIGKIVIVTDQSLAGSAGIGIDDLAYAAESPSYYMTPTGAGTKDGSDWANALAAGQLSNILNTVMQPGDTLYLGSGDYGNKRIELLSSGTAASPKRVLGVDTGAGLPLFDSGNWSRTAPNSGINGVISLGTGASHWSVANLSIRNCKVAVNAPASTPARTNLVFGNLDIQLVRYGLYLNDCDDLTIEDCSVTRYTKHAYRLNSGCDTVTFCRCVADLSNGDSTWWDYSEIYPYGFIVANSGAASNDITFLDCVAMNNLYNNNPVDKYWNGDGFVVEPNTVGLTFLRCIAINNEDGGYDIKPSVAFQDCVSIENARGFRCKTGSSTLTNCVAIYPRRRGGAFPNTAGLWAENATVVVDAFSFLGDDRFAIHEEGAGSITVTNSILAFTGANGSFTGGSVTLGAGTVTYRPGSGTDPQFVNPSLTWDGLGNDMDSQTYGSSKGYFSGVAQTIIVDNADSSGVTIAGTGWQVHDSVNGFYGPDYLHRGYNNYPGASVTFTPTIATAGNYAVYARWCDGPNRCSVVPIDVQHSGGAASHIVDQRYDGGDWVLLGVYPFAAGTGGSVTISSVQAYGYIVADAVKFEPQ